MAWWAPCDDCGRETEITEPVCATLSDLLGDDLRYAKAFYQPHRRTASDTRSCSGAGKQIPQAQMAHARSDAGEEAVLDAGGWRRRRRPSE